MRWIHILIIAPIWGALAVRLMVQSFTALAGFVIALAGLVRGQVERRVNLLNAATNVFLLMLWIGLFYFLQWLAREPLQFVYSGWEGGVFWVTATVFMLGFFGELPGKLQTQWRYANEPGAIEQSIWRRKLKAERFYSNSAPDVEGTLAVDLHRLARDLIKEGKPHQAIDAYLDVIREAPERLSAYEELLDLYVKVGEKENAIRQYKALSDFYEGRGLENEVVRLRIEMMSRGILTDDDVVEIVALYGAVLRGGSMNGRLYPESSLPAPKKVVETALVHLARKEGDLDALLEGYRQLAFFVADDVAFRENHLWRIVRQRDSSDAIEHIEEYGTIVSRFQEEAVVRRQVWDQLMSEGSA